MRARPACAAAFYTPASAAVVDDFVHGFAPPALPGPPVGAAVPHAGWSFSGRTAARTLFTLKAAAPPLETLVFLGAVHRLPLDRPAVDPHGAWETPFGELPVNEALAAELLAADLGLAADPEAHRGEHAIEVSLPLVRHFFPDADFVPIACPPSATAADFGARLGARLKGRPVAVVASTDLTHYGRDYGFAPAGTDGAAMARFMRENDERIIALAAALDAPAIVPEARENANACGSGALAAAVGAALAMGATQGILVEYTTSAAAFPGRTVDRAVGYAGMVFA